MKYFLALFCIVSSSFSFGMDGEKRYVDFDKDRASRAILMHYLHLQEAQILNEGGIEVIEKRHARETVTLYCRLKEDYSEHPLAKILQRIVSSKKPLNQRTVITGSPDEVHRSNEDLKNNKLEFEYSNIEAVTMFLIAELDAFSNELKHSHEFKEYKNDLKEYLEKRKKEDKHLSHSWAKYGDFNGILN